MPNITDPEIWDKLSDKAKVKWLQIQAELADPRCSTCLSLVCDCDSEVGEPDGF